MVLLVSAQLGLLSRLAQAAEDNRTGARSQLPQPWLTHLQTNTCSTLFSCTC